MKIRNLFALLAVAGLLACGPTEAPAPDQPAAPTPVAAAPTMQSPGDITGRPEAPPPGAETAAPAEDVDLDAAVATVGSETITNRDLMMELQIMEQRYASQIPPEYMAQMRPRFRQQALAQLVNQTMVKTAMLAEAARQNLASTSEEVDAALMKIESQMVQQGMPMETFLQMRGWSKEQLREQLGADIVAQQLYEQVAAGVSDASVEEYYEANKQEMAEPPQMRASHILFSTADRQGNSILPVDVAEASAETVLGWIKAGSDFAELAAEYSGDPGSARNGGDLGFFAEGQMVPAFNDTVLALEEGEVSGLVPTEFGFHLIKKTGAKEGGIPTLEESEEMIRNQLERQVVSKWLEGLVMKLDLKASYANPSDDPANQAPPSMPGMGQPPRGGGMR